MDFNGRANGLGMELLNQSNYKVWSHTLWVRICGMLLMGVTQVLLPTDQRIVTHTRSRSRCKSAHEIWRTLDQLFNKKNEAQLQILENELANTIQEYIPFVTSIQGWAQQPSLEEFENLLSSQELLAKQMVGVYINQKRGRKCSCIKQE
ncbi:hypothetical protein KY284_007316 [Solanum tuberosum]|nr:hypothetical protein KY284_007316 [Solanum tuberosum]